MGLAERFGRADYDEFFEELGEERFQMWWARDRVVLSSDQQMDQRFALLGARLGIEDADEVFGTTAPPELTSRLRRRTDATATEADAMAGQSLEEAQEIWALHKRGFRSGSGGG